MRMRADSSPPSKKFRRCTKAKAGVQQRVNTKGGPHLAYNLKRDSILLQRNSGACIRSMQVGNVMYQINAYRASVSASGSQVGSKGRHEADGHL